MVTKSKKLPSPSAARKRTPISTAAAKPRAAPPGVRSSPSATAVRGKSAANALFIPRESVASASSHLSLGEHAMKRILLIDLAEREMQARARLDSRVDYLNAVEATKESSGGLSVEQEKELKNLLQVLDSDAPVDEFYKGVASQVARRTWVHLQEGPDPEYVLKYGLFGSQQTGMGADLGVNEREIASVCGLLELDNLTDPANTRFVRSIAEAQGEYRQNIELFNAAYALFKDRSVVTLQSQIDQGTLSPSIVGCITPDASIGGRGRTPPSTPVPDGGDRVNALSARTLAQIVRRLVADRVTANDTWLSSRLESAFNVLTGSVDGAPPSAMEIDLPDLEAVVDIDIVKENLNAVQAIYFSYQLEEMRMYQVVERIVELFRQGLLPLGRGRVGDYLYRYYQKAAERITESERRDLYFRCFGAPGGNPNVGEPNRDFNDLWLRFLSAVSSFARQLTVDRLLRSTVPMSVTQEQVRKAGRDLGANLSRNGFGIAYNAAIEMQQSILEFRDVLTDPDLRNVFGARDMWQVIDLVNANYLGGSRNTHRFRTQSRNGAIIIRWIANHVQQLSNVAGPVLLVDQIVSPQMRSVDPAHKPTVDPTDWDLVNACEQWLAVGGVQEQSVEQYAQPIESPITSARPIGMPQMARDALDSVGISLPN
jgi:hypothetical protein